MIYFQDRILEIPLKERYFYCVGIAKEHALHLMAEGVEAAKETCS
jgi:hypothetical protein